MIESLELKFGATPDSAPLRLEPGPVTVFIGPNNSGKSLLLRELGRHLSPHEISSTQLPRRLLKDLSIRRPASSQALKAELLALGGHESDGHITLPERLDDSPSEIRPLRMGERQTFSLRSLEQGYDDPTLLLHALGAAAFIKLDGATRLSLVGPQKTADLTLPPVNILQALFVDEDSRKRLRTLTHEAMGLYAVIDPTGMRKFNIRLSSRPPSDADEEQCLGPRAREFYRNAIDIHQMSDGIKAYTGLLAALLSRRYRLITIDEPEAFLHPALSRRLGVELSRLAAERKANVFVATHSADFLMGCIDSGSPVQIVRLTYQGGLATATHLPSDELTVLMRTPLLRTTNVLSALFSVGAVVTESEADRAFYDEINHRLQSAGEAGAPGVNFLFAQNKQTTHVIVRPLRRLGIAAAAIVDMDFMKDGGKNFTNHLHAAGVPVMLHQGLGATRQKLKEALDAANPDWKIRGGLSVLSGGPARACQDFLELLADYGLFIVPGGELESWLQHLGARHAKHAWLHDIFEKMGSDPTQPGYATPSQGDVWAFMRRVARWLQDPHRKGMSQQDSADASPGSRA